MQSELGELSGAMTKLTLDLFREVSHADSNTCLSPVSIALGLAMTYAGASGSTAMQMNKALFSGTF